MEAYLKEYCYDQIVNLLNEPNDRTHASLQLDLSLLQQHNFDWFQAILLNVYNEQPKWNEALFAAQKSIASEQEAFLEAGYQIKSVCHVRFIHLPASDRRFKLPFPNNDQVGLFRDVKGTVVRMSQVKLLETKRDFICSKCGTVIEIIADYGLMYRFDVPKNCTIDDCKGNIHQKDVEPNPNYCVNYQELKVQEALSEKNIPPTLIVTVDADLVDCCQPGDCVTICGTVERRWISFNEARAEAMIAMRAVSLVREQNNLTMDDNSLSEQMMTIKADWLEQLGKHGELGMRDIILKSICPDVYGLYPVKLAIVLAICSGNDIRSHDGLHQRGQSHVLMVGDPGMAKSKLLLSAVSIAPRAVHTTGMGCSSAGLTAAAIKEDGEWVLEAGALVLADGGICCIDEFNLMRESDRASIHEAMEQQTISMAKAGIVCKLNTRCAILAAANPKNLHAMSEPEGTSSINIGIATPLLSRFDLAFILKDERIPEWDDTIADHLLAQVTTGFQNIVVRQDAELWDSNKLQTHFVAVSKVQPKMTPIASAILGSYYRKCRSDQERDQGRTTVRLLDSLNRLAESHARLLFREEVTVIDAIVTIRLMESTLGFGRIVKPYDVIKETLPLGPDAEEIKCILEILEIDEQSVPENEPVRKSTNGFPSQNVSQNAPKSIQSTQNRVSYQHSDQNENGQENKTQTQTQKHENQNVSTKIAPILQTVSQSQASTLPRSTQFEQPKAKNNQASNFQAVVDMDPEKLDEILSFDNVKLSTIQPNPPEKSQATTSTQKKDNTKHAMSDDEDMALSQLMDDIETSIPAPKMPRIELKRPNRLSLNLRFKPPIPQSKENKSSPCKASTSDASASPAQSQSQALKESTKNRMLCTPSDDEISQNEPKRRLPTQTLNFLNKFKYKGNLSKDQPLQQKNVHKENVASKSEESQPENDSAYDTMLSNLSFPSTNPPSCRKTGKTPPIFGPSGATQNQMDDDDLSFLDTFEIT